MVEGRGPLSLMPAISVIFSFLLIVVVSVGVWLHVFRRRGDKDEAPSSSPNIVVNLPADWKPLEAVTPGGTTLGGAQAALWYAVYKHTLDSLEGDAREVTDLAVRAADKAIATAFPPQPPPPKSRAQVWQEVYERTFGDSTDYAGVQSQRCAMESARQTADAAVDKAFPEASNTSPSPS